MEIKLAQIRFINDFLNSSILQDDQIICLDETGFYNLGNSVYGYFPKGQIPQTRSFPRKERFSVLMAIHPTVGICCHKKQKQSYNKASFLAFLQDHHRLLQF